MFPASEEAQLYPRLRRSFDTPRREYPLAMSGLASIINLMLVILLVLVVVILYVPLIALSCPIVYHRNAPESLTHDSPDRFMFFDICAIVLHIWHIPSIKDLVTEHMVPFHES